MNNKMSPDTYSVKILSFLYKYLTENGYDCTDLLAESGLEISVLDDPDKTMTILQKKQITKNIIAITKDPLIGLKMGKAFRLDDFGTLGYAALCAKTRGESLKILLSLQLLIITEFEIKTELQGEEFSIQLYSNEKNMDDVFTFHCDMETASTIFSEGDSEDNKKSLIAINFMHNQTHLRQEYESFFGCTVNFNRPFNEVVLKKDYLEIDMPRADIQTSKLCLDQCKKILSEMTRVSGLIEKVREIMLSKAGNFPNILEVSSELKTSERTLRRKLKEEKTSFQSILNEVRSQLAKDYLKTELAIEQIAELIGYSEPANFSNAFKRWTSLSPKEYRQTLQ